MTVPSLLHQSRSRGACGFIQSVLVCCSGVLFSLVSLVTVEIRRRGKIGFTSLDKMPTEVLERECRQGKVYKAAVIQVEQGHEGGVRFYLASVILCLLIKVKGVRCHTLLLDICFFQVEEMFKDCWMDLLCAACPDHILSQINMLQFDRCAHH